MRLTDIVEGVNEASIVLDSGLWMLDMIVSGGRITANNAVSADDSSLQYSSFYNGLDHIVGAGFFKLTVERCLTIAKVLPELDRLEKDLMNEP